MKVILSRRRLPDAVYRIDGKTGELTQVINNLAGPNGLCFSPDESVLYVVECLSQPRKVWAYDVMPDGTLGRRKAIIADIPHAAFDGIKCDQDGNLWCGWGSDGSKGQHPDEPQWCHGL
ncbi:SMP-30/gluconolactonase/LRE family protein [Marinomonas sp. RS-M-Aa-14]|uniref:SMP-30/gluconolactonase/LRE family protein n=1 Tax=Marinomonas sp. RS-M-Aa-14 TaxID=3241169 RepID=UPI003AAB32B7